MDNFELIIKPRKIFFTLDISEIWRYRELFYVFAWRDVKVRYKQTILGLAWVIFQPLVTTGIFSFFFGRVANIPSGNLPYPLFVLIGLVFWSFFSNSLTVATNSMIENENIIKKVYFPKIILPVSAIITGSIDFAVNLCMLLVLSITFGFMPSLWILLILPLCYLITIITIAGVGLFLCALNVKYRDVRYILPFFIQLLLFITPVIYPFQIVSPTNRIFLALNPMSGVIESFRAVFSQTPLDIPLLLISVFSASVILLIGFIYFKRTEEFFADIV